jgi:pyridoxamine 5'-phosphate oxidase family protein
VEALALVLALAVTLLVVGLTLLITVALSRRRRLRVIRSARWRPRHYSRDGATVVAVSLMSPDGRVLDEHVVDRLPQGEPDWTTRFVKARQEADERAFHLNDGAALPD